MLWSSILGPRVRFCQLVPDLLKAFLVVLGAIMSQRPRRHDRVSIEFSYLNWVHFTACYRKVEHHGVSRECDDGDSWTHVDASGAQLDSVHAA
ncbi:hypothetical protein IW262DRAFT_1398282 [Armillaria fumosa]|nr:hypothetical protein IW262DRAFT_1398282 [Armillaria fumosa]